MQTIGELETLDLQAAQNKDDPHTVGLVLDFEQLWYFATLPQAKRWNQSLFLQIWYRALARSVA